MPAALSTLVLAAIAFHIPQVSASPILDDLRAISLHRLLGRQSCAIPCGWQNQYCCNTGQFCVYEPSNGITVAKCTNSAVAAANVFTTAGSGYWSTFTSTWVRTDLVTMTTIGSTYIPTITAAAPRPTVSCNYDHQEKDCGGSICCRSDQYCVDPAKALCGLAANPGSSGIAASWSSMFTATMSDGQTTTGFLPPLRPTSDTNMVSATATTTTLSATATASAAASTTGPTTTVNFLAPIATGGNYTMTVAQQSGGAGLSPGAIAGIVFGVLAAIVILFFICVCCCLKAGWNGFMALMGRGKKDRERVKETEYIEEHRSRRTGRDDRSWYGGSSRPSRIERTEKVKKSSGGWGKEALGIGAGLAGLAAVLGLKRSNDKKKEREREKDRRSEYTDSRSGSDLTSASSESSRSYHPRRPSRARERSRSRTVRSVSRR